MTRIFVKVVGEKKKIKLKHKGLVQKFNILEPVE